MASVTKDFHRLMKRVGKLTDGQVTISNIDWDEGLLRCFHIVLRPNSGLYKNGKFKFEIRLLDEYPDIPPVVWCHTDIYHPNIDPTEDCYGESSTNVCLNLLEHGVWNKSYGLEGTVLGLLFLMHNPNFEDPLSPHFDGCDDEDNYRERVKKYMAGEEFEYMSFNTGFCVRDGILIEEMKVKAPETDNDVPNSSTDVNDIKTEEIDCATETVSKNGAENDKICADVNTSNDAVKHATNSDEIHSNMHEKSNDTVNDVESVTTDGTTASGLGTDSVQCTADASTAENDDYGKVNDDCDDDDDENNIVEIELANVNGEFVFYVHNSDTLDINQTVDRNTEDDSDTDIQENIESNSTNTNLNNMNPSDNIKANSELDTLCSTSTNENVIDEDLTLRLIPQASGSQTQIGEKDEDSGSVSIQSQSKCHCWLTVRYVVCKIVHAIIQNRLYRDIGF